MNLDSPCRHASGTQPVLVRPVGMPSELLTSQLEYMDRDVVPEVPDTRGKLP